MKRLGIEAERRVQRHYQLRGYVILDANVCAVIRFRQAEHDAGEGRLFASRFAYEPESFLECHNERL